MKSPHLLLLLAALGTVVAPVCAQSPGSIHTPDSLKADTAYGQPSGTHEITIGGSGASNNEFDSSFGSVDFSYGQYLTERSLWVLRQNVAYSNPENADNGWNGSTRLVYDYSLNPEGPMRPFLGVGGGRVYGANVNDSWTAGLEGGAKFYTKSQTFIFAAVSYDWFFDQGGQIDEQFNNGRFGWTLGVGYQF